MNPTNNAYRRVFASAARTATENSAEHVNREHHGVRLVIDVTAVVDTPSIVFKLEGRDEVSGQWFTVLASAAVTGVGTSVLEVFPGAPVVANVSANSYLPKAWRVRAEHADADSATYSVGAELLA